MHSFNQLNYQSSFDYDNLFQDLKSDSYLKSFSQKKQSEPIRDNQIRSNYQFSFQNQQNQDNYFSTIYHNNNNFPPQHFPQMNPQYEQDNYYQQKQNSPPKNQYNIHSSSYVPSFHNSPTNSHRPPSPTYDNYNPNSNDDLSYQRRSPSPPNSSFQYPLSYERNNQNNYPHNNSYNNSQNNDYSHNNSFNYSYNNNYFPQQNIPQNNNHLFKTNTNNINTNNKTNMKKEGGVEEITIEVWEENMVEELRRIVGLSEKYCVVGYDCEFPGVVYQPKGFDYKDTSLSYPYLKSNVDNLEIIQIGFSLSDVHGNLPSLFFNGIKKKIVSWQFNFKFDLNTQPHNSKSISLLKNSGIDFEELSKRGIDSRKFGPLLLRSGLFMNEKIRWITFHSMFDYGYLIKLLTGQLLPSNESQFFNLFHTFFPTSFDIKYFFHHHTSIKVGGLEGISKSFKLERKGIAHQAGSDSFLTVKLFFAILKSYREQWINENFQRDLNGSIFGLNFSRNQVQKVF